MQPQENQEVPKAPQSPMPTSATHEDLSPQKGFGEKVFGAQRHQEHASGQDSISEAPEEALGEATAREGTSVERTPEEMVEIRKQLLEETRAMLPYSKEDGTQLTSDERNRIIAAAYRRLGDISVSIATSVDRGEPVNPLAADRILILKFALNDYEYQGLLANEESRLPEQVQELYGKMDLSARNARPIIPWLDPKAKMLDSASYRVRQSQQDRRGSIENLPEQEESATATPQTEDASDQPKSTGNPPQI